MNIDSFVQIEVVPFVTKLGLAIFILVAFWIGAKLLRKIVHRFALSRNLMPDITNLLLQISEAGLLIFGGITALGTLGVDVWALIAGLGLAGFAIGFALKDLLSNFLAGFLILIYNPFVRGDQINVTGHEGVVVEINLRYTVLKDQEKKILIPNSSLFSNAVVVQKVKRTGESAS